MQESNPYQAPAAEISEPGVNYGEAKLFAWRGRIGRLRYIAYGIGAGLILMLALGAGVAVMQILPDSISGIATLVWSALFYIAMVVVGVVYMVRRLNDFNMTGWLGLLMLVPIVNLALGLALWFVPGTKGENKFGPPPPPNSLAVNIIGWALPVLFVVGGILAAISIPAYQDYVQRAQQAQQQQMEQMGQ